MAENKIDHVYFDPFCSSAISVHSYCDYVPYLANAWILISLFRHAVSFRLGNPLKKQTNLKQNDR